MKGKWDNIINIGTDVLVSDERKASVHSEFANYKGKPIQFLSQVLGEKLTSDQKELIEKIEANDITVSPAANGVGKTRVVAAYSIYFYKVHVESQVYTLCAPPVENLTMLLWGEIGAFIERRPAVFEMDKITSLNIARSSKSYLTGVTIPTTGDAKSREARVSGKHAPDLLFVMDEADAIPPEIYRGIESCMSGGNAKEVVLLNPRRKSGVPYDLEMKKRAAIHRMSALTHPNVVTGKNVIPGAVTRKSVVERINNWTAPANELDKTKNPGAIFFVPEFLVGEKVELPDNAGSSEPLKAEPRVIIEPSFYYMVLGKYPEIDETTLIPESLIDESMEKHKAYLKDVYPRQCNLVRPSLGLDVADKGTDSSMLSVRYGNAVSHLVEYFNLETTDLADEVAMFYKRVNAKEIFVDSNGAGASMAPMLRRLGCNAHRIMVTNSPSTPEKKVQYYRLRDELWHRLRDWLKAGGMIPDDQELKEELLKASVFFDPREGKLKITEAKKMKNGIGRSLDKAYSVMMSLAPVPVVKSSKVTVSRYA